MDGVRDPIGAPAAGLAQGDALAVSRLQCLTWTLASRRRLEAVRATAAAVEGDVRGAGGGPERGGREALERRGDLLLGIVALDQALTAARWIAGAQAELAPGAPGGPVIVEQAGQVAGARSVSPVPLDRIEAARQRVRAIRNLVVHLDDRLAASLPATLDIDAGGLRASQGRDESYLGFDEWAAWLDALETWLTSER